jgi:ubiquinone/menaquinone biosynthesis C-methylase UbiE
MVEMDNQKEWEDVYSSASFRHKNEYPSDMVIEWVKRHYGNIAKEKRKSIKCLDLGCGWGNNLNFLKREGFDAYGIDFSERAVTYLKSLEFQVVCSNFENIPFEDNSFDFVIDKSSIQHNSKQDITKIIREVYRVLRGGADSILSCLKKEIMAFSPVF